MDWQVGGPIEPPSESRQRLDALLIVSWWFGKFALRVHNLLRG